MHSATDICVYCATSAADGSKDVIVCYGFCGKSFHLPCLSTENSNFKPALMNYLTKINGLHWYCNICVSLSVNGIASSINASAKLLADIQTTLQPQLDQIKLNNTAVQAKSISTQVSPDFFSPQDELLLHQTQHNMAATSSPNKSNGRINSSIISIMDTNDIQSDESNTPSQQNAQAGKRRLSASAIAEHPKQPEKRKTKSNKWKVTKSSAAVQANGVKSNTGPTVSSNLHQKVAETVVGVGVRAPKSSLDDIKRVYVSPFRTNVECTDIMDHLRSVKALRSIIDKIECTKLTKKDVATENLTFVSFGINVPKRYVTFLTHASVWPPGIVAREFEDKPPSKNAQIHDLVATRRVKGTIATQMHQSKNQHALPPRRPKRGQSNSSVAPQTLTPITIQTAPSAIPHIKSPATPSAAPTHAPLPQYQLIYPGQFMYPAIPNQTQFSPWNGNQMSPFPMYGFPHQKV